MPTELDSIRDISSITSMTYMGGDAAGPGVTDTYQEVMNHAKAINARMLNTDEFSATSSFEMKELMVGGARPGGDEITSSALPLDTSDFRLTSLAAKNLGFSPTSTFQNTNVLSDLTSSTMAEIQYGLGKVRAQIGGSPKSSSSSSSSVSSSSCSESETKTNTTTTPTTDTPTSTSDSPEEKKGGSKKPKKQTFITGSRKLPGGKSSKGHSLEDEPAYLLSDSASELSSFGSDWSDTIWDNSTSEYSTLLKA